VKTAWTARLVGNILTLSRGLAVCRLRGNCSQSNQRPLQAEGKHHNQRNELALHELKITLATRQGKLSEQTDFLEPFSLPDS
jgi:hypothetical protein